MSSTHNLQEELLLELDYGICVKEEQELFHILQRNLYYFINNGIVIDYTSRKDISHLSRTQQNLILKNKLMSLNYQK